MADSYRPEVASGIIASQNVEMVQLYIVTKFEGPSSNRLGVIQFAHFVKATTTAEYASHHIVRKNQWLQSIVLK